MITGNRAALGLVALIVIGTSLEIAANDEPIPSKTDRFAFEVLDPSMEFVWTTHRIRLKLLARLGIPDSMELKTVPDRTSDWWYAQEKWWYHGGPTLIINSNDYEWLESVEIPVNTQIPLPFGLIVGSTRDEIVTALEIEDSGADQTASISFMASKPTKIGHSCVTVTVEFDEQAYSKLIAWKSGCH